MKTSFVLATCSGILTIALTGSASAYVDKILNEVLKGSATGQLSESTALLLLGSCLSGLAFWGRRHNLEA